MKRLLCLCLAVLLILSALVGCSNQSEEKDGMQLWLLRESGDALGLVTQSYGGEATIPAVMEAMLFYSGSDLKSPVPEGTRLLTWRLDGDLAWVDLSAEYGKLTGLDMTLADYAIVLVLTQLDQVNRVRITVDGLERRGREGMILSRNDVVLSGAEEEPVELTAALCFRRTGGNELGEELRIFRLTESQSATLAVLRALLTGPTEPGLQALLPSGLEVNSARVEAGICYADFSALFLTGIPESEEEQMLVLNSVVESLQSLGYIQAVQFLVEGEPLARYGQIDLSQPLG